jgi:hypothetical protein
VIRWPGLPFRILLFTDLAGEFSLLIIIWNNN